MDFASDNASGADPKILAALVAANSGSYPAYGADPYTLRAEKMLGDVFEPGVERLGREEGEEEEKDCAGHWGPQ